MVNAFKYTTTCSIVTVYSPIIPSCDSKYSYLMQRLLTSCWSFPAQFYFPSRLVLLLNVSKGKQTSKSKTILRSFIIHSQSLTQELSRGFTSLYWFVYCGSFLARSKIMCHAHFLNQKNLACYYNMGLKTPFKMVDDAIKTAFQPSVSVWLCMIAVWTRPFFDRSIDRVTHNFCYKPFKSLHTYQIELESRICYVTLCDT